MRISLTIHRGSHEIGGSCVELRAGESRLVLDLGIPLKGRGGEPFDNHVLKGKSATTLVAEGLLPDISGLYSPSTDGTTIEGVLLSHAHMDHHGLLGFIREGTPVHGGAATHELLRVGGLFMDGVPRIQRAETFRDRQPFSLGPFTVTPFLMDHSAFDAHAFLIECDGRRVLYSGDFREGGWKLGSVERLLPVCEGVDLLLLEGTTVGRIPGPAPRTEPEVVNRLVEEFREHEGRPVLIWASGQNVDRISSVVKACNKVHRTPVVDVYTGMILELLSRPPRGLPHARLEAPDGMRVFFPERTWKRFYKMNQGVDVPATLKGRPRIFPEELNDKLGTSVLLVRDSMLCDLEKMENCRNGLLVYSMWSGYKRQERTARFLQWLEGRGFTVVDIHASGHADEESLRKLVSLVSPNSILPIHTEHPEAYDNLFPGRSVLHLEDGKPYPIP